MGTTILLFLGLFILLWWLGDDDDNPPGSEGYGIY